VCGHLSLNSGVATAVNNLAAVNLQDLGGSALQQLLSLGTAQNGDDTGGRKKQVFQQNKRRSPVDVLATSPSLAASSVFSTCCLRHSS
jgi:hypothetical protein